MCTFGQMKNPDQRILRYVFMTCLLLGTIIGKTQQLSYKQYTVEDGLPSNTVYQVIQDKKGFIWACSDAGISRFDGKNFLNFGVKDGLQDNEVIRIVLGQNDRIWYQTLKGKIGYMYQDKVFPLKEINMVLGSLVTDIFSCNDSCVIINTKDCKIFHLTGDRILNVTKTPIQQILSGTLVFKKPGETSLTKIKHTPKFDLTSDTICIQWFVHQSNEYKYFYKKIIPSPYFKQINNIFIYGSVIYSLDSSDAISTISKNEELSNANLLTVSFWNDNNFLLGSLKGLLWYQTKNNKLRQKGHFLRDFKISSICIDKDNTVFLGTLGKGIIILPSINIFTLASDKLVTNQPISAIHYDSFRDKVFIGTEAASAVIMDKTHAPIKTLTFGKLGDYERVVTFKNSSTSLFIGTDSKLYEYSSKDILSDLNIVSWSLALKAISVFTDVIWFGSFTGLENWSKKLKIRTVVYESRTTAIYQNKYNEIWFSNDFGLNKLVDGKIVSYGKKTPLLSERFLKIEKDKNNNLWLASQGKGLVRYNLATGRVNNIGSAQGLADDVCNSFLLDSNKIWVATNSGVSKITFTNADRTNYTIQNIGVKQGLASNNVREIIKAFDYVYVATANGLCYFKEDEVKINAVPPPVYITNIKLWDRDTTVRDKYTFSYKDNNIRIDFIGLAYKTLGDVKYLYKMEGIDNKWLATKSNSIGYPSLPPGKYRFLVKAINEDGIESAKPASLILIITAPYWQKWWFWMLISVLSIGVVGLIAYYRLKSLRSRNQLQQQLGEAEQKALRTQMNPHFVFNALNSIQRFILENDSKEAHIYLAKFGKLIRAIFQNSSHKSIALHEEIETLKLYLELESLRFSQGFDYEFLISEKVDTFSIEIPSMIIQPYVENAIWHGLMHKPQKGLLTIKIDPTENGICCIIQDNGIGRKESLRLKDPNNKSHKSSAMAITEQRLRILKETTGHDYRVEIVDLKDDEGNITGTKVLLFLAVVI